MNTEKKLHLRKYVDYHQSYLELADHPHEMVNCVKRTVRIHELIEGYQGPAIAIDFDVNGYAIGIEILYPYGDEDDD